MPVSSTAAYPIMMKRPPAAAMVPLTLIFVCGFSVGALAMSWMHHGSRVVGSQNRVTVVRLAKELNLSDGQQRELETTLDDLTKYYSNVLSYGKDSIMRILDDNQKRKFERLLQDKHKP